MEKTGCKANRREVTAVSDERAERLKHSICAAPRVNTFSANAIIVSVSWHDLNDRCLLVIGTSADDGDLVAVPIIGEEERIACLSVVDVERSFHFSVLSGHSPFCCSCGEQSPHALTKALIR